MKNQFLKLISFNSVLFFIGIVLISFILFIPVYGQTEEKKFESLEFLVKMNYSSDWTSIKGASNLDVGTYHSLDVKSGDGYSAVESFCPSSELPNTASQFTGKLEYINCIDGPPVSVEMRSYRLPDNTSLTGWMDGEIKRVPILDESRAKYNAKEDEKVAENNSTQLSEFPAYKIVTTSGESGQNRKTATVYTMNDNIGYAIIFRGNTPKYFDYFYPTFQKMLDSFKIIDLG